MSRSGDDRETSKSRQREQILQEVAQDPNASPSEIADRVSGASVETVERALENRDDSADDRPEASSGEDAYPEPEEISDRQIRTLQTIAAHPDATQRDIASFLDVSAATVSNRVNSLPGFEWENRRQFVKAVLDLDSVPGGERSALVTSSDVDLQDTVHRLTDRLDRLEEKVEALEEANSSENSLLAEDPELTRKIVRVCMRSEEITDDEELRVLEHFVDR